MRIPHVQRLGARLVALGHVRAKRDKLHGGGAEELDDGQSRLVDAPLLGLRGDGGCVMRGECGCGCGWGGCECGCGWGGRMSETIIGAKKLLGVENGAFLE